MGDPTLLEVEAARAMSGRPAWRVVAACVKGGACPRCESTPAGVRCKAAVACNERVWAQRARERAAGKMQRGRRDGALTFIRSVAEHGVNAGAHVSRQHNGGWCWPSAWDCAPIETLAMDAAIACGYVRLINSGGPVWVVTDAALVQAAAWAVEVIEADAAAEQAGKPSALTIDAAQASADFSSRIGDG